MSQHLFIMHLFLSFVIVLQMMLNVNAMDRMWYIDSDSLNETIKTQSSVISSEELLSHDISHNNKSGDTNEKHYDSEDLTKSQENLNHSQNLHTEQMKVSGRSAKMIDFDASEDFSGRNREPRILNDEKSPNLSIKGFIPIVGFGNDKHDNGQHDSAYDNPETDKSQQYSSSIHSSPYDAYNGYAHQPNPQKHLPRPEDQRFIGAALQGITASLASKPSRKFGHTDTNYNYGDNLSPFQDGCICVPFYMCKNGYLTETAKNSPSKSNSLEAAQSLINQLAMPMPNSMQNSAISQRQKHANSNPLEHLPLDERSTEIFSTQNDYSFNKSAPQYADEILTRMLGMSRSFRSEGCGLLRTCCRTIAEADFPSHAFPSPTHIQSGVIQVQESSDFNKRFTNQYQPFGQQIPYDQQYDISRPEEIYPTQVVQSSYNVQNKPYHPSHNFDGFPSHSIAPQIPLPIKPEYPPYKPINQRPVPIYAGLKPAAPHSIDGIAHHLGHVSHAVHGSCGVRQSVSVHGRVQNLNYHESSTEFGEHPWQVAILKRLGPADSLYICGGVLISPLFVATAAHCIKKFRAHDLKVRVGEWDVHRDDEFYPYVEKFASDIIVHPQFFAGNLVHDIALIRIESPLDFSQYPHIAPACLPERYENFAGLRCLVSGWGKNAFGHQGEFQSVLKQVDLPVLGHGLCEQALKHTRLGPHYQLHQSMICAGGEPGKDACEGDGGSPLICEVKGIWKVAGLVSWGVGCGQPGVPGVYTNIAYVKPWIESVLFRTGPALHGHNGHLPPNNSLLSIISERSNARSNSTEFSDQYNDQRDDKLLTTTESSL